MRRLVAAHPVAAFLLIAIGVLLVAAAIPPLTATDIPPFDSPLFGVVGGILGVGLGAFVVTAATAGRAGVEDLLRRSFRWRVPARWYLLALFGVPVAATLLALAIYGPEALESPTDGWPKALAEVAALFLLQLVLFQLAEEIGFTGFLQDRWQDRFSPLRLTAYVAFFWALWHVPDHFGEEGWGLEQLVSAPVVLVIEFVSLFFARALFVWLYARTGRSVLLVAVMHASFDASISELSYDVVPGSNAARFLIFSAVIVLGAVAVIVATRGRFAEGTASVGGRSGSVRRTDPTPRRGGMFRIVALFVTAAAIAVAIVALTSSASGITRPQVISLLEVEGPARPLDPGATGERPTLGSRFAFTSALYKWEGRRRGDRFGRRDGVCTWIKVGVAAQSATILCTGVFFLPAGQIYATGMIRFAKNAQSPDVPVIGGTGRYANVRGVIKVTEIGRGKANLEFHLTP